MAALNGYSAGGKTGTAQKVDPVTHTYSQTKLVASFAGFAPVSNPAISVAVVIDTPTVGGRLWCAVECAGVCATWRSRCWSTWACRTIAEEKQEMR